MVVTTSPIHKQRYRVTIFPKKFSPAEITVLRSLYELTVPKSLVDKGDKSTEWPKKMYTLFTHQYLWNKLWQCLDADGGHFEHLHWIQNSRTSLISILFLYKYSSYDYRIIFFMSKCVYIILGHSVYELLFPLFTNCWETGFWKNKHC